MLIELMNKLFNWAGKNKYLQKHIFKQPFYHISQFEPSYSERFLLDVPVSYLYKPKFFMK